MAIAINHCNFFNSSTIGRFARRLNDEYLKKTLHHEYGIVLCFKKPRCYNDFVRISSNSAVVRRIGLAFMLLALAALETSVFTCSVLIP